MHILIADDDEDLLFLFSHSLKRWGHVVETTKDGEELLERLGADGNGFDVIVTDNNMPRLSGIDVVRRLRADNRFEVPIIVHSGDSSIAATVAELGAVFVEKTGSTDFSRLLAALDAVRK